MSVYTTISHSDFSAYVAQTEALMQLKLYPYQINQIDRALANYVYDFHTCSPSVPDPSGRHGYIFNLEMGLGKTIITAAFISMAYQLLQKEVVSSLRRSIDFHCIIVCPAATVHRVWSVWMSRLEHSSSAFSVAVYHGSQRHSMESIKRVKRANIVITTYEVLRRMAACKRERHPGTWNAFDIQWDIVVYDEIHMLGNGGSLSGPLNRYGAALHLATKHSKFQLGLTGTLLRNSVFEMKNIAKLVNFKPSVSEWYLWFRSVLSPSHLCASLFHREWIDRVKDQLPPLPLKREFIIWCRLTEPQIIHHTLLILLASQRFLTTRQHMWSFDMLNIWNRMRYLSHATYLRGKDRDDCDDFHPQPYSQTKLMNSQAYREFMATHNSKSSALLHIIHTRALPHHNSLVVFVHLHSATDYLIPLIHHTYGSKVQVFRYDSSISQAARDRAVSQFQNDPDPDDGIKIMFCGIKCGGVGIDLYHANIAFIYDGDFVPANELQAIGRVYRNGQHKPVEVYRAYADGNTVDRSMRTIHHQKATQVMPLVAPDAKETHHIYETQLSADVHDHTFKNMCFDFFAAEEKLVDQFSTYLTEDLVGQWDFDSEDCLYPCLMGFSTLEERNAYFVERYYQQCRIQTNFLVVSVVEDPEASEDSEDPEDSEIVTAATFTSKRTIENEPLVVGAKRGRFES